MTSTEEAKSSEIAWKIVFVLMGILSSAGFGLSSIVWARFGNLEAKITNVETKYGNLSLGLNTIESSRCTASDCADIRNDITKLELLYSQIPKEIPPAWLRSQVDRNTLFREELQRNRKERGD